MKLARRCLVFGGSGTLGRVVCRSLAAEGARVAFTYCTGQHVADELRREIPASVAFHLDARSVENTVATVDAAAHAMDGIDAFVQCIGAPMPMHPFLADIDEKAWDDMMDVNVKSTFFAVRHLVDIMRAAGGGNIVLLGSVDSEKLLPAPVHYGVSKSALSGMVKTVAKEVGAHNIRVNLVAPGVIEAGLSRSIPPDRLADYLKHCGMKRVGKVSEIANVVVWFALHNEYVTGQSIVVDGAL